uniref:Uncharacterized protein n=1 Tax=Lepeophtheirus salmonis TaxID=72036 RepID=A0A0K2VFP8_LEPSM
MNCLLTRISHCYLDETKALGYLCNSMDYHTNMYMDFNKDSNH